MEFKVEAVTWNDINRWCQILSDTIMERYQPEAIVGLSRGGLVPARILSDSLLIKDLYAVKTEHWGITASMDGTTRLKATGKLDIQNKKVLVVDDITDTGESMEVAVRFLETMSPESIMTATMLHITHSKFRPDFFAVEVPAEKWTWFTFPWNVTEDLYNLTHRVLSDPLTTVDLKKKLRENFGLVIPETELEENLHHLEKLGKLKTQDGKWLVSDINRSK